MTTTTLAPVRRQEWLDRLNNRLIVRRRGLLPDIPPVSDEEYALWHKALDSSDELLKYWEGVQK